MILVLEIVELFALSAFVAFVATFVLLSIFGHDDE